MKENTQANKKNDEPYSIDDNTQPYMSDTFNYNKNSGINNINNKNSDNIDNKNSDNIDDKNSDIDDNKKTKDINNNKKENEKLNIPVVREYNIFEEISNFKIGNFINQLMEEIKNIEEDLNISTLKNDILNLSLKNIIIISFLWFILLINIIIYTSGDLHILFFSDINIGILIILIKLCLCFVLLETLNIIRNKNHRIFYDYILFFIYFVLVLFTLFISLLDAKGWGWEFYLVIILINLNLIIYPKFNIYYKN